MKHIVWVAALLCALLLAGCSGVQSGDATTRLAVQYGTMKVIEQSGAVTADGVLRVVDAARAAADREEETRVVEVRDRVLEAIGGLERFSPADRMLILALVDQIQAELTISVSGGVLSEDARVRLHTLLDWVEQAALMAGGGA